MKTKSFFLVFTLMFSLAAASQENQTADQGLLSGDYSFLNTSPQFGMQMGTSFATGFGGTGFFSQSFAPYLQFRPGQNFAITVGSTLSTGSFAGGNPFLGAQGNTMSNRMYSTTLYALGAYQVNSRLVVTGAAWTERNNLNQTMFQPQMNPQAFNLNAHGMMIGMDYRITENLSVGAEVRMSQGGSFHNPFMHQQSSFQQRSPMHRNYPW